MSRIANFSTISRKYYAHCQSPVRQSHPNTWKLSLQANEWIIYWESCSVEWHAGPGRHLSETMVWSCLKHSSNVTFGHRQPLCAVYWGSDDRRLNHSKAPNSLALVDISRSNIPGRSIASFPGLTCLLNSTFVPTTFVITQFSPLILPERRRI